MVLTSRRVWAGDKSTRLGGAHWARARSQWPSPFHPSSLSPPGSAAHAQGHFWHTLSVRRWSGAAPQRGGRLVARSAIAAWRDHHVSIGGGCHAKEQRWNGQIGRPRPLRKPPWAAVGGVPPPLQTDRQKSLSNCLNTSYPAPCASGFEQFLLLTSTPAPFTRAAAWGPAFWASVLEKTPGRRLDVHRQPSRQSRALDHACDRQRRCAPPLALGTRGTPFTDTRTQSLMHRHSSPLQRPDDTPVVPRATAHAARRVVARKRAACQPVSTTHEHPPWHAQACQLELHRRTPNASPPVW